MPTKYPHHHYHHHHSLVFESTTMEADSKYILIKSISVEGGGLSDFCGHWDNLVSAGRSILAFIIIGSS